MLSKKSLVSIKEKEAPYRKVNEQRITILACANASDTHKLSLCKLENLSVQDV